MRFELFDYQRQAALECLDRLDRMRDGMKKDFKSSFGLSSLTGSGKTVIATAVIEATIFGSSDLGVDPDPRASFLWVTDDPSLNQQTIDKMYLASEQLQPTNLRTLDAKFMDEQLSPGVVYFLNIQKLSSGAKLTKTGSDSRLYSMWDILKNTIDHDGTDLYLVLDEAHRGMKQHSDRKSIVEKIIDGQSGMNPEIPAVWGISATIDRFTDAMSNLNTRDQFAAVQVDIDLVRASGLVKDEIGIEQPAEAGGFSTTLLREAVKKTLDYEERWAQYSKSEGADLVLPALVVQVPDKPTNQKLSEIVATIEDEWPGLGPDAIAHVFGDKDPIVLASGRALHHVPPESIQGDTRIRVVLAKEAISTGWDCPRAEVMYSERSAQDATHIAQIVGRMVRQPLAQRIDTDDTLNTVACYLPLFNQDALTGIVNELEGKGESGSSSTVGPTVTTDPETLDRNPAIDSAVFDFVNTLPSIPAPTVYTSPLRRARKLAHLLCDAGSGSVALVPDAPAELTSFLNSELDGLAAKHKKAVAEKVEDLETAEISRKGIGPFGEETSESSREIATHISDLKRDVDKIVRSVKEGAGLDYYKYLVDEADDDADLLNLKTRAAALFITEDVLEALDEAATKWAQKKLEKHDVAIKHTTGEVRNEYRRVQEMTIKPEALTIDLNDNLTTGTKDPKTGVALPTFERHLYCDKSGKFPFDANGWENEVIAKEIGRETTVGWYRNPSRATHSALRIAYQRDDAKWTSLQPDFVVISKLEDGALTASIVDPHGDHFADARPKLIALATFAEEHGADFVRIDSITKVGDELRVLDLTDEKVREAVRDFTGTQVIALYQDHASAY